MKLSKFKSIACLILCAAMILPCALTVTAAEPTSEPTSEPASEPTADAAPAAEACEHKFYGSSGKVFLTEDGKVWQSAADGKIAKVVEARTTTYVEGTCAQEAGYVVREICINCAQYIITSSPADRDAHEYGAPQTVTAEKSCDGRTYTWSTCTKCGYIKVEITGEATKTGEHVRKTESSLSRPMTHTSDKITVEECQTCGAVLECILEKTEGHTIVAKTIENATCQKTGLRRESCYADDFTRDVIVPKTGHLKAYTEKPATCESEGSVSYTCSFCGQAYPKIGDDSWQTKTLPKLEHNWVEKQGTKCDEPATYEECSNCHQIRNASDTPKGHVWGDTVKVEATCGRDGVEYHVCTVCGIKETISETPASGAHQFQVTYTLKAPSCTEEGISSKRCSICGTDGGESYHTVIPKNDHLFTDDSNCETEVVCKKCGAVIRPARQHNYSTVRATNNGLTHMLLCSNEGCSMFIYESCSAQDDGNCMTALKCVCGYVLAPAKSTHTFGEFVPTGDASLGHIRKCGADGCTRTYGQIESHTFDKNGECTVCGYKNAAEHVHVYDGYQSDASGHYQICTICHTKTETQPHDAASKYDGDCGVAVKCSVCGYEVMPALAGHSYAGGWQRDAEHHYRTCTQPGCEYRDEYEHSLTDDDHDCTTPSKCSVCGYVVVAEGLAHSWFVEQGEGTEAGHYRSCSNEGCEVADHQLVDHTVGIGATCCSPAECTECHTKFGALDPDNHVGGEEIRGEKAATETEEGYTGDIYCLGCGKIKKSGETIPKTPSHTHSYTVSNHNTVDHWNSCSVCGAVDESSRQGHDFDAYTDDGNGSTHTRKCRICGYGEAEPHEHGEENHDCTAALYCVDCGAEIVSANKSHNFSGRAIGDENGHRIACTNSNCTVMSDYVPHTGGTATCQSGAHCEVCGVEYTGHDMAHHVGGTELRGHKNATETEKGYTGDTYCLGCGELIAVGSEIDVLPTTHEHSFGAWMADKTHHWRECACGDWNGYAAHTYENGVCTVCGALDPDHKTPDTLVGTSENVTAAFPVEDAEYYSGLTLTVDKIEPSEEDFAGVKDTVGKEFSEFVPFEINLYSAELNKNVQPKGEIKISIPVPQGWRAADTAVYHVSGGDMEKIAASVSADGAMIEFTTTHLSVYVLVNTSSDAGSTTPPEPGTTEPETDGGSNPPKPGDREPIIVIALTAVAAAAACGIAAAACAREKKRQLK